MLVADIHQYTAARECVLAQVRFSICIFSQ